MIRKCFVNTNLFRYAVGIVVCNCFDEAGPAPNELSSYLMNIIYFL